MKGPLVWDLPTRLFHWGLVVLVLIAWRSAETEDMTAHGLAGSGVAGLLVFRLWWGLFGGSTARFAGFVKGPGAVAAYARSLVAKGKAPAVAGHNPMGGWSVAALLACLIALVGFGLFAVDTDGMVSGPLSAWVEYDTGRAASHYHALAFDLLEGLVALHLLAIVFYHFFKRHNLVGAMVTGRLSPPPDGPGLRAGSPVMLALGAALGLATALLLARLGGVV